MRKSCFLTIMGLYLISSLEAQNIYTSGAARNVMTGTDLSVTVWLDSLIRQPHLYALGPVEDLQGEITAVDGNVYTAFIEDEKIRMEINPAVKAPFLVYAYVGEWKTYDLDLELSGLRELEMLIDSLAGVHGYGKDDAFPFVLTAQWDSLAFHIIMRDRRQTAHSHALHEQSKVKFYRKARKAKLTGFFSRHHQGVFTHKGSFIHVHYLDQAGSETGHLDDLVHSGKLTLSFPASQGSGK